jgi:hypothetical protein
MMWCSTNHAGARDAQFGQGAVVPIVACPKALALMAAVMQFRWNTCPHLPTRAYPGSSA